MNMEPTQRIEIHPEDGGILFKIILAAQPPWDVPVETDIMFDERDKQGFEWVRFERAFQLTYEKAHRWKRYRVSLNNDAAEGYALWDESNRTLFVTMAHPYLSASGPFHGTLEECVLEAHRQGAFSPGAIQVA